MVPMSSNEIDPRFHQTLLGLARESIVYGLRHGREPAVDPQDYPAELRVPRATFVTLHRKGALRGCIGSLEAYRPLLSDVVANAYAAAFSDPRFPSLTEPELDGLDISISVLTPPEEIHFRSEEDLLEQLRPGIDGVILQEDGRRGTFLPSVWEQLPDRRQFLEHLKLKAGLPPGYWSDTLRAHRYTAQEIGKS